MIKINMVYLFESIIGFSSGLVIGAAFVAILTVLGVIPRLIQLSHTGYSVNKFVFVLLLGGLFGTYLSFTNVPWNFPVIFLLLWGAFHGIFNGMLAAALVEILNVFPLLTKRIGLERYLLVLLTAIVFGKVAGSLFQWMYFSKLP